MEDLAYLLLSQDRQLACSSGACTSCVHEDGDPCCGCICMDCVWGLKNIGECEGCNEPDGTWPYGGGSSTPDDGDDGEGGDGGESEARVALKNSTLSRSSNSSTPGHDGDGEDKRPGLDIPGQLKSGTATISKKEVSVCPGGTKKKHWGVGLYRYPAFPAKAAWPWDGIENGRWDSISRYWGNTSADCADWSVGKLQTRDFRQVGGAVSVRADYQSKLLIPPRQRTRTPNAKTNRTSRTRLRRPSDW